MFVREKRFDMPANRWIAGYLCGSQFPDYMFVVQQKLAVTQFRTERILLFSCI